MGQEGLESWFCGLCMLGSYLPSFSQPLELAVILSESFFQVVQSQEGISQGKPYGSIPACSSGARDHKVGPKANPALLGAEKGMQSCAE